jgi:hypothetical protein
MTTTTRLSREWSPRALARAIALLFLLTIVLGIIAQLFISDRLISWGDAARTASNIRAHESLYGTAFTLYLIEMSAQIAMTVLTFHLLRPVNRRLATVALAFGLVGCTIKTFSRVFYLVPIFILKQQAGGDVSADQLSSLVLTLLTVNDRGAGVALPFFGLQSVLEGWLILHSTFLPRWLGVLTIVTGAGWLTFLSPTLGSSAFSVVAPLALIGSMATIGWFLVKGVDEARWLAVAES